MTTDAFPVLVKEEERWQIARKLFPTVDSVGRIIELKKEEPLEASKISEGSEYKVDRDEPSSVSYTVEKLGVIVRIPYEWIEDKNYELRDDKLKAGIRAVMREENELVINTVLAASGINTVTAATGGTLAIADIAGAIDPIETEGYTAHSLIVHPDQANDLRAAGTLATLERRLEEEYDMNVFVTDAVTTATALVVSRDSTKIVLRRDITNKESYDGLKDEYIHRIDERVGAGVVRPALITKITGC